MGNAKKEKAMRVDLPLDVHRHLKIEAASRELTMSQCALQLIIERLKSKGAYVRLADTR